MQGLFVAGTTLVGAGIGGGCGIIAAMFWADMEIGSLDAAVYIFGGMAIGGVAGAYVGGQFF